MKELEFIDFIVSAKVKKFICNQPQREIYEFMNKSVEPFIYDIRNKIIEGISE